MIYADKEKNENQYVSVNSIARGRILQRKEVLHGINFGPPSPAQRLSNQSRAPSIEETEVERLKDEKDLAAEEIQAKTMTASSSSVNQPTGTASRPEPITSNSLPSGGEPIPEDLRPKMEAVIGGDFTAVRLHHDTQAATVAERLGAKAFTHKTDIYFNQGQYQPETKAGEQLLAHELTHVKQQMTVPGLQAKLEEPTTRERYEDEADAVAQAVTASSYQATAASAEARMGSFSSLSTHQGDGSIQLKAKPEEEATSDANWLLEQVSKLIRNIPGYYLLALVIGRDPLTGQTVKGDGLAWARAAAGLLPGGNLLFENLEKAGVITRAVTWLKGEIEKLGITFAGIKDLFDQAWTAIVGPKTPEKEEKPAEKRWYERLGEGVKEFTSKAGNIIRALFSPEEAFNKLKAIFLPPIERVIAFLGSAKTKLLEFTFEGALTLAKVPVEKVRTVLNKGKGVLQQIFADPVGFLSNLLKAIHGGLNNFKEKIGTYLQSGLAEWLFGALSSAGIIFPATLNLSGIFSLIAQILGVTWQAIKARVIKLLGPTAEKVITQIEKTVTVIVDFITKGPIALYEMAMEFLGDLKARFFDSVIEWARNTIIVKGVQKLIAMFNPVGAIIQAIMTIGSTIKFFIDKAKQIAAFTNAVFDSITEIAAGNLKKAISAVENSLAKALPVAIGFLANLAGIGGIAEKIKDVIKKLRQPIDKAVEKVVGFVADKARALMAKVTGVDKTKEEPPRTQKEHDAQVSAGLAALDGEQKKQDQDHDGALTYEEAAFAAEQVKQSYPVFKSLTPIEKDARWVFRYVASPVKEHVGFKVEEDKQQKTKVEYGGTHGNVLWVEANPLTKKPGNTIGSEPKEDCPGWDHAQDLNQIQQNWHRGHLLSRHLHGPGLKWNLVPLTAKTNSAMANEPEKLAKKKVLEENKTLYYKTTVTFHDDKEPIKFFPAEVVVTVKEIVGNKINDLKTYMFTQDKPAEKADEVVYNLNTVGRILLKDKFKINEGFAKEVITVRENYTKGGFKNKKDFYDTMFAYYSNTLDKTTKFTHEKIKAFNAYFSSLELAMSNDERLVIE